MCTYRVIVSHNARVAMLCVFKVRRIRCQHFGQSHDCFACKTKNEMASLWGCQLYFKQAKKFSCNTNLNHTSSIVDAIYIKTQLGRQAIQYVFKSAIIIGNLYYYSVMLVGFWVTTLSSSLAAWKRMVRIGFGGDEWAITEIQLLWKHDFTVEHDIGHFCGFEWLTIYVIKCTSPKAQE